MAQGVPQGRLNLAQDAVLGCDSRDEKSRRDDWKLPAGNPSAIENSRSAPPNPEPRLDTFQSSLRDFSIAHDNPGLRPGLSSAVPVRQAQGRLYGTQFVVIVRLDPLRDTARWEIVQDLP
jgi:hypothetical protein